MISENRKGNENVQLWIGFPQDQQYWKLFSRTLSEEGLESCCERSE